MVDIAELTFIMLCRLLSQASSNSHLLLWNKNDTYTWQLLFDSTSSSTWRLEHTRGRYLAGEAKKHKHASACMQSKTKTNQRCEMRW